MILSLALKINNLINQFQINNYQSLNNLPKDLVKTKLLMQSK